MDHRCLAFIRDPSVAENLCRTAPAGVSLNVVSEWPDVWREIHAAGALIVHLTARSGPLVRRVQHVKLSHPLRPVILMVPKDAEILRQLILDQIMADSVVWQGSPRTVWSALESMGPRPVFAPLATIFHEATGLPRSLRSALLAAVTSSRPPRRVAELATLAYCDRTTLWRQWRSAFGEDCPLTPSSFLDWLLLLHGIAYKRAGHKWSAAAAKLDIHEHTLKRITRRLLGTELRTVNENRVTAIEKSYYRRVVEPLAKGLEARREPDQV